MAPRKNAAATIEIQTPSELEEQSQDEAVGYGHLDIWDNLSHTDPSATKGFSRQGGFKGTAIKPIWQEKMMTATFGPVGIGWGMTKPDYEHVVVGDEVLVYCTIGVWYKWRGEKSDLFWGEGGDAMVKKRRDGGVQIDDEARKKSLTDALGNAFKRLGMAGDIHMGLWEDSKYQSANINYWFNKEVETLEHELKRKLPGVGSIEALNAMKRTYGARIKEIRNEDEDAYERLVAPFAQREKELAARPAETLERTEQPQDTAKQIEHEPPVIDVVPEATVEQPVQEQQEQAGETMSDEDYVFLRDLEKSLAERIEGISDLPSLTKLYKENKADLMKATSIDKVWGNKIVDLFSAKRVEIEAKVAAPAEPSVTDPQAPPQATITELRTGKQPEAEPEPEGLRPEQIIDPNRLKREDNPAVNDWPEFRKRAINTVRRIVNEDVLDQWVEAHAKWVKQVGGLTTVGQYPNGDEMSGDNVRNDINLWVHRQRSIIRGTNLTMRYGEGKLPSDLVSYFADVNDWAQHLSDLANSEARWMNVKYNVEQAEALAEQHKGEDVAGVIRAALSIYKDQIAASAKKSA